MKIADLRAESSALNNTTVEFTGEVVGDIVNANETSVWFTVVEDGTAISVLVPAQYKAEIDALGRYGVHGTEIKVTGEFSLDCFEHQGLLDVHANTITIVRPGYVMTNEAVGEADLPLPFLLGGGLAALALLLGLLRNFIVHRNR